MTREDYVHALKEIRRIVESDTHIEVDTHAAILAEIDRVVSSKPPKYGDWDQCSVCGHTPRYCDC